MKKLFLPLLICSVISAFAAEPFSIKVEKIYPPNQLPNPEFKKAADGSVPHWFFGDFSKRGGFTHSVNDGEVFIETTGKNYGYFSSDHVPVEEGVTYYAGAKMRSSSKALIWMETRQYNDKISPYFPPYSNTKVFLQQLEPSSDPVLKEELKLFIDPQYIIDSDTWITGGKEFTVPVGHGVNKYIFMLGCYGGRAGFFRYKEPFVVKAEHQIKITLDGKNLKQLNILTASGKLISTHQLKPDAETQQITGTLKSRITLYYAEIIDVTGKKYRKNL